MKRYFKIIVAVAALCCFMCIGVCCIKPSNARVTMSFADDTDYGIYWFGEDNEDYVRSSAQMDKKYFDSSKPTLVFFHGWEPSKENSANGLFEDFVTHKETISKTGTTDIRDYAKEFKKQGYNVASMSWFAYAASLVNLFNYIWVSFDGGEALSVKFAMEFAITIGEDYDKEIKFVGHSYGSQLALATTYQLIELQSKRAFDNNNIIPTRLTLADPYFGATAFIGNWDKVQDEKISFTQEPIAKRAPSVLFADILESVVRQKDIAADMYFGMSIASSSYYKYDGSDESFEKLSRNSVIVKCKGLDNRYGNLDIHNIVRDWTLLSIADNVGLTDQYNNVAPSGAATDGQIKNMRGKCYNQVYKGLDLSKDSMVLVDRYADKF